MKIAVEAGDILVREGVIPLFGVNYGVLSRLLDEDFNHAGVAISSFQAHHVESNGYEDLRVEDFFSCKNAKKGAVIRFVGPYAAAIRMRVAENARKRSYLKFPGNVFSSGRDLRSVNCNEFVYTLYQQAIKELMEESYQTDPLRLTVMKEVYSKSLILPRQVRIKVPGTAAPLVAKAAEKAAQSQARHPDLNIQFEGNTQCGFGVVVRGMKICIMSEVVLDTYTPNSFISSWFFRVVERSACDR